MMTPIFLAEVHRYEGVLNRMLLLDSQLMHHIESQPLLDSDQIASTFVVQSVHKVQLVATCVPVRHQILVQLSSSPFHLMRLFS
jgi:hypothetical protein